MLLQKEFQLGFPEKQFTYLFSGKTAISLILDAFKHEGKLKLKTDEILVPNWMGSWIYMTIQKNAFPVTKITKETKGVFVYHQWGFPQKIDKILEFTKNNDLFCIEDCAHSFESYFGGSRLGTLGDASVFSFSKFFPSVVGGAILSKNNNIHENAKRHLEQENIEFTNECFLQRAELDDNPNSKIDLIKVERDFGVYDKTITCPLYSLQIVEDEIRNGALDRRRENYNLFRNAFKGYMYLDELMIDGINPWILPLFLNDTKNYKIAEILIKNNIESGVYNFDINRNLLDPNYIKCVVIPCHHGITEQKMSDIIDLIKKNIK